jgi:hypothetical protein
MANLNDSSGIFVGNTLDAFTAMETLVARDGDVAGAQAVMFEEMNKLIASRRSDASGSGETDTRRTGG